MCKYVATGSWDDIARIWNVETGACVKILSGHTSWVFGISWSLCGKYVATGSWDKTARIWNVETGACVKILSGYTDSVDAISWSPCGKYVATGSDKISLIYKVLEDLNVLQQLFIAKVLQSRSFPSKRDDLMELYESLPDGIKEQIDKKFTKASTKRYIIA